MDRIIEQMIKQYEKDASYDKKNRLKEVIQEICLCGLSRAGFFRHAAFYGGTALRIFHELDRFSEDLDFSLKAPDNLFDLAYYIPILEKETRSYGLNIRVEAKEKSATSPIQSAFLKGNTKEHLLMFYPDDKLSPLTNPGELIKVKIEVDINPPEHAGFETKYRLLPIPYEITLYDMPSLFAGKVHAVLCRAWKNRVKGRDLYDYLFYLSKGTLLNIKHLNFRLAQSGFNKEGNHISLEELKKALNTRFENIDYNQAKQDIKPFIKDPRVLDIWSADFFCGVTQDLRAN